MESPYRRRSGRALKQLRGRLNLRTNLLGGAKEVHSFGNVCFSISGGAFTSGTLLTRPRTSALVWPRRWFQKTGNFLAAGSLAFDDSNWVPVDLPHDWAVRLPFQNDPNLASKGSTRWDRDYPETSVGWYRRVFELPASDAGKRITIEFDGSYRERW